MRRLCWPALACAIWGLPRGSEAGFVAVKADEGPATMNANAVSFADFDGDGHTDFTRRGAPEVWLGNGDGTFVMGGSCEPSGPPVVADFDNDAKLDILRIHDQPVMCRGLGDGTFEVVDGAVQENPSAGLDSEGDAAHTGAATDLNLDGWLDLYMTNYEGPNFIWYLDVVYMGDGTGGLDVDHEVDVKFAGRNVDAGDVEGDGDPDIYVSNYRLLQNFLFQNDGMGGLADVAGPGGATGGAAHTISSAFGDLDNDLDLDLFVGNFAHAGQPEIKILRNDIPTGGIFEDLGSGGITWQESYAGVALGDYDNDGDLDVFITTVYAGDFGRLYRNDVEGGFVDVTADEGLTGQHEAYGVSWADVNEDGALDLFLGGKQDAHLFLNQPNGNHWLSVGLSAAGSETVNAAAIGARVFAHTPDADYLRDLQAGGSAGERGSNELRVHFGLADYAGPVELEVEWPAGLTCFYPAQTDTRVDLVYSTDCDTEGSEGGGDTGDTGDDGETDTGDTDGTGDGDTETGGTAAADDPADPSGCGCTHAGEPPARAPWAVGLLTPLVLLRRRR